MTWSVNRAWTRTDNRIAVRDSIDSNDDNNNGIIIDNRRLFTVLSVSGTAE